MNKITLSFVSFVAGALIGFPLLSGTHISAVVQSVSAAGIALGEYEPPIVHPLDPKRASLRGSISGTVGAFRLDGLNCVNCVIESSVFEYGGGAINCVDCRFPSPKKNIVLTGAAANTLRLLQYLQSVKAAPQDPPWLKEGGPKIEITLNPQTPKTMNLVILP